MSCWILLVTVVAYALAWFIVISGKVLPLVEGVLKAQVYFMALVFIVPVYLILYASFHLYVPKRIPGRRSELANICKGQCHRPYALYVRAFWPAKVREAI